MKNERKKLYIAVCVNFLIGIMAGIVLFYGQLRANTYIEQGEYTYTTTVELMDFFRVTWLNLLWFFSIFIAHNILPAAYVHPIVAVRGCSNSFSVMYMLRFIGIKEAAVSALSQCFSILPALMITQVRLIEKRRQMKLRYNEPLILGRRETLIFFISAMLAGAAETLIFRFFCLCLF